MMKGVLYSFFRSLYLSVAFLSECISIIDNAWGSVINRSKLDNLFWLFLQIRCSVVSRNFGKFESNFSSDSRSFSVSTSQRSVISRCPLSFRFHSIQSSESFNDLIFDASANWLLVEVVISSSFSSVIFFWVKFRAMLRLDLCVRRGRSVFWSSPESSDSNDSADRFLDDCLKFIIDVMRWDES
jgi:hypothetical protein